MSVVNRLFGRSSSKDWIHRLSAKWHEIPLTTVDRGSSIERMQLSDTEFMTWWDDLEDLMMTKLLVCWVVEIYRDYAKGRKLIEVGPGAGVVGIQLLRAGARVHFIDVAKPNLDLIERVCRLKEINGASFMHLTEFTDPLKLTDDYDCVLANGSLHHTPAEISKPEFEALASRLKLGGRFLALTYPKERWEREGSKPFSEWGKGTDGELTPWAEWYDERKLLNQLAPYRFRTLMAFNYHNNDFNWFDLQKIA